MGFLWWDSFGGGVRAGHLRHVGKCARLLVCSSASVLVCSCAWGRGGFVIKHLEYMSFETLFYFLFLFFLLFGFYFALGFACIAVYAGNYSRDAFRNRCYGATGGPYLEFPLTEILGWLELPNWKNRWRRSISGRIRLRLRG